VGTGTYDTCFSRLNGWRPLRPNSSFFEKWPEMGLPSNSCAEPRKEGES
jgi:hypothetical protein